MHALLFTCAVARAAAAGGAVFVFATGGVAVVMPVMAEVEMSHGGVLLDAYLIYFRYI
jgi:hypothetical protein